METRNCQSLTSTSFPNDLSLIILLGVFPVGSGSSVEEYRNNVEIDQGGCSSEGVFGKERVREQSGDSVVVFRDEMVSSTVGCESVIPSYWTLGEPYEESIRQLSIWRQKLTLL